MYDYTVAPYCKLYPGVKHKSVLKHDGLAE